MPELTCHSLKYVAACPAFTEVFLPASKQQWNPTAAVLSFQRMATTFPLLPASEVFGSDTFQPGTPSGKADKHSILYNIKDGWDCLHLKHQRITTTTTLCLATAAKPGTFKFQTSKLCQMLPTPNNNKKVSLQITREEK